ncbi:hypothetical protein [Paenibacillus sp. JDR-2]|uniref:hypothetical protein n=1 Tax=Paenibacillus sp. (strain JDR-2) TaxID=324057 RepID=UPI0001667CAA|nr:hypothetical protein [Paenibacillus sp. JDR-2]ACT01353.1 hypothetical protein Pjdr2_2700 [Paenibacillus sp. JDR-2]
MHVNKFEVKKMKSTYCDDEHYCFVVDGAPLDYFLNEQYPEKSLLGLVPTIPEWMCMPAEKEFVLSRFHSSDPIVLLPVLMCPDDCDLWCTLLVAEVEKQDRFIRWNRIGYDRSTGDEKIETFEYIGNQVDWLEKIPPFIFKQEEYETEIKKLLL